MAGPFAAHFHNDLVDLAVARHFDRYFSCFHLVSPFNAVGVSGCVIEVRLYNESVYNVYSNATLITLEAQMLTILQIKQRLKDSNLRKVAIKSGVHPATVYRFMRDQGKPAYETVELLSNYLTEEREDAA